MSNTEPTACECSKYDALVNKQLTEANLETGDYDIFETGCTATTRKLFAPGHDAKLKSFLIKYSGPEFDIRRNEGGVASSNDAEAHGDRYEFGYMVRAGIDKARAKAEAKARRKAAKAAKAAERKQAKPLADVVAEEEAKHAEAEAAKRPEPEWDDEPAKSVDLTDEPEIQAKVGRWTYKGIEKDGVFYYLAKDGHTRKETTKYQVV